MQSVITRRAGAFVLFAAGLATPARAAFPDRPIRMIVAYPPGGTGDLVGRLVAEGVGQRLGATVVVENQGGAGGAIAARMVNRAAPDGYTIMLAGNAIFAILPHLSQVGYDPDRRLHRNREYQRIAAPAGRSQHAAGCHAGRVRRLRQGPSGQAELRLRRHRLDAARHDRDAAPRGRLRGGAHPIPRLGTGCPGDACRRRGLHDRHRRDPARRAGPPARARCRGRPPPSAVACRTDAGGAGLSRRAHLRLAGADGPAQHAARHRRCTRRPG